MWLIECQILCIELYGLASLVLNYINCTIAMIIILPFTEHYAISLYCITLVLT